MLPRRILPWEMQKWGIFFSVSKGGQRTHLSVSPTALSGSE